MAVLCTLLNFPTVQGRAWSLQINDDEIGKLPFQIMQIQNEVLKKKLFAFVMSKGDRQNLLKPGTTYNVEIFLGQTYEELAILDSPTTVCIDKNMNQWHEYFVSLHLNCSVAFYGQRTNFQDVIGEKNDEMVFLRMKIKSKYEENSPIAEGFKSQTFIVLKTLLD